MATVKPSAAESTKSKRGGARPGAGRKKKADILKGPIERIKGDIEEIAPLIGPSLRELVEGIWVEQKIGPSDVRRVYRQPPDIRAIQEVVNRIAGKVADKTEHSGSITTEIKVEPGQPRKPTVQR